MLGISAACVIVTGALALLLPLRYTSVVSFVPERSAATIPTVVAGLASQFGIGLNASETTSPYFYARIVKSRSVLDKIVQSKLAVGSRQEVNAGVGDSMPVLEVLRARGDTPEERLADGVERLGRIIKTDVDPKTDIVTVAVQWKDAVFARELAQHVLDELNRFNAQQRQSSAGQERAFLEQRLVEARGDLRASEDSLSDFLERNRRYTDSPSLVFIQQRLQRQVDLKARVYESLAQAYEQARIREVNNTPVITVIEGPVVPVRHSWPRRRRMVVSAAILGLLLGLASALAVDYLERAREERNPEFLKLNAAWARVRQRVTAFIT